MGKKVHDGLALRWWVKEFPQGATWPIEHISLKKAAQRRLGGLPAAAAAPTHL
jgi:hypothetical protein